jgi:diacylglycerol kinase family enzyme
MRENTVVSIRASIMLPIPLTNRRLGLNGQRQRRYFVNAAEFGMGGVVMEKVNQQVGLLGGRLRFLRGILASLPEFRSYRIQLSIEGRPADLLTVSDIVVANGRYFGAGLCPAPQAELDDGLFDVVCFGQFSPLEVAMNLGRLWRGTHLDDPKVRYARGRRVEADADERVLLEMDGEVVGRLPAVFEIIPRSLPVSVPKLGPSCVP